MKNTQLFLVTSICLQGSQYVPKRQFTISFIYTEVYSLPFTHHHKNLEQLTGEAVKFKVLTITFHPQTQNYFIYHN
jgi:hypothetical protein